MAKKRSSKHRSEGSTYWLSALVVLTLVGVLGYLAWTSEHDAMPSSAVRPILPRQVSVDQRTRTLIHENPQAEVFESTEPTQTRVKQVMVERPDAEVFEPQTQSTVESRVQELAQESPDAEALEASSPPAQKKTLAPAH